MRHLRLLLLLLCGTPAWAGPFGNKARGTSAAEFLKVGVGARAAALGEAYGAVADDASALYWNPAGLTQIDKRAALFMHAAHIESTALDFGAYAQRVGDRAFGASVHHASLGRITGRDVNGATQGDFSPADTAFAAAYAHRFPHLSLGITGKAVRSRLQGTASTLAMDLGLLSRPLVSNKLTLGLTATNLGGRLKFDDEGAPLPLAFRAAAAVRVTRQWLLTGDVVLPRDDDAQIAVGTEYTVSLQPVGLALRAAGFSPRGSKGGGVSGVTGGLGFALRGLSIDYAFVPYGELANTHRVSLGYKF